MHIKAKTDKIIDFFDETKNFTRIPHRIIKSGSNKRKNGINTLIKNPNKKTRSIYVRYTLTQCT